MGVCQVEEDFRFGRLSGWEEVWFGRASGSGGCLVAEYVGFRRLGDIGLGIWDAGKKMRDMG